ncbi:MAG: helix-turn-helix domain-containing protein [Treponema sp.]|jgi:AraC-like DNA-binding protein|nr:helix-turn-helix domain-containing protein [Treponema sp.]
MKRKRSWGRWLFSYLVILALPLLLSVLIFFVARSIILRETREVYAATLEQARAELDSELRIIYQMLDYITLNGSLRAFEAEAGARDPERHFALYQLVSQLRDYRVVYPLLEDTLVVFNERGTLASTYGHMSMDLFVETFLNARGSGSRLSADEFQKAMPRTVGRALYLTGDRILFLQSMPSGASGSASSAGLLTVALVVDKARLAERCLDTLASNGSILYVTDRAGRLICESAGAAGRIPPADGGLPAALKGWLPLSTRSAAADWDCHFLIPTAVQESRARQIQLVSLGGLVLCAGFGVFFSVRQTRRTYGEFHEIELSLEDKLRLLRTYCLYTLLEKPFDPEHDGESLRRCGFAFSGGRFMAALFDLPDAERTAFARAFRAIAAGHFAAVELTDAGPRLAAVLNWAGDDDKALERLDEDIEAAQRVLREQGAGPVKAALSGAHAGPEGIFYAAGEARETLRCMAGGAEDAILHYSDVRFSGAAYRYPLETEQKLINLIRMGDTEAARLVLAQTLEDNAPLLSSGAAPLLAADLAGTLMKGSMGASAEFRLPERLSPKELTAHLYAALEKTCKSNRAMLEGKKKRRMGEQVREYVDEHFRDPDLNISLCAYHFNLSPAYISALFHEDTGRGLLDYINSLRIEESKKLLAAGASISKAAGQAGFRAAPSFIRIFRKYTGLTPGQFREL